MQRVIYLILGVCLILFGTLLFTGSFQNITGLVVADGFGETNFELAGAYFIFAGLFSLFLSRKRNKGQAAMEFLMTYGWAILAMVFSIGTLAYFGVFNQGGNTDRGFMGPPFYWNAGDAELTGLTIEITNKGADVYTIRRIKIDGCGEFNALISISAGVSEILNLPCDLPEGNFKADITIYYTKPNSNLELNSIGKMTSQTEGAVNLVPNWLMSIPDDPNWLDAPEQVLVFDYNNIESYAHDSAETIYEDQCFNWAGTPLILADPSKAYKYSIWIKSTGAEMNNYFGFHVYDSTRTQIASSWANPYFKITENDPNTWQKWEAFLGPSSYGPATTGCDSLSTNGDDWCMASNTAYLMMRFGSCYTDGLATEHSYFMYPEIEEISWPPS